MTWDTVTLRNFQCHKKLALVITPGVTVITGRSDAGKSAVLRAIRWLCLNRPNGSSMLRHGADAVRVSLDLTDLDGVTKYRVERRRGKGGNLYVLDGTELKAFGAEPPDVVSRGLNVGPDNFQRQHDPLFWLSLSPGELAKRLNAMTGFDKADEVKAGLAARRRRLTAELDVLSDEDKQLRKHLAASAALVPLCRAKRRADETAAARDKLARSCRQLAELVTVAVAAKKAMETAAILGEKANAALAAAERRNKIAGRVERLAGLIADVGRARPEWLTSVLERFAVWRDARTRWMRVYDRRGTVDAGLTEHEKERRTWREKRKRLRNLLAKVPKCPLCLTVLSPSSRPTGT